jgi:type IV pilus assembly protein PilW
MSVIRRRNMPRRSKGFSLIELIIALGLGVVVTAGIVTLFVGNNETYSLLNNQARLQENARYALDFVSRSARSAGYFGCDPEPTKIYNSLNGAWTQLFEFNISTPIQAFNGINNGTGVNDWLPALTPLPRETGGATVNAFINGNGIVTANLRPLTDVLVLRHVEAPGAPIAQIVQASDNPVVNVPAGGLTFGVDDFVAINNCEQASVFRVTALAVAGATATLTRGTGGAIYQNAPAKNLSEQGVPYGEATNAQGSAVGRVLTDIYFIAAGAGTNNRGATPWSLWRKVSEDPPVELVEGVEDLQVLFGIDTTPTNNVASANRYVTFDQVGANPIRSLRVTLTSNSVDVVPDTGQPLRRTFSQTISFRNG